MSFACSVEWLGNKVKRQRMQVLAVRYNISPHNFGFPATWLRLELQQYCPHASCGSAGEQQCCWPKRKIVFQNILLTKADLRLDSAKTWCSGKVTAQMAIMGQDMTTAPLQSSPKHCNQEHTVPLFLLLAASWSTMYETGRSLCKDRTVSWLPQGSKTCSHALPGPLLSSAPLTLLEDQPRPACPAWVLQAAMSHWPSREEAGKPWGSRGVW